MMWGTRNEYWYTAGAFLALLCLSAALLIWLPRLRKTQRGQSVCGSCGYPVFGLSTFTCPECGSDLRAVGIAATSPSSSLIRFRLPALRVIFFTIALLVIGWPIAMHLHVDYWPMIQSFSEDHTLTPESRQYTLRYIIEESSRYHGRPPLTHDADSKLSRYAVVAPNDSKRRLVRVRIAVLNGPQVSFNLIQDADGPRYSHAAGVSPVAGQFNEPFMLSALAKAGLDTTRADIRSEAAVAHALLKGNTPAAADDPWGEVMQWATTNKHSTFGGYSPGPMRSIREALPFGMTSLAVAALVWLIGATWIVRRCKNAPLPTPAPRPAPPAPAPLESRPRARICSIMFTDMTGFTARAAHSSRQELLQLLSRQRDIVEPAVKSHGGRIIKSTGDGFLITFDSATDAVLCAQQIQSALARQNGDAQPLQLRISIATGEIIEAPDDILGDAVNLASRLQSACAPGEVCLSESTYATLNKREIQPNDAGSFNLKGYDTAVRVYKLAGAAPT